MPRRLGWPLAAVVLLLAVWIAARDRDPVGVPVSDSSVVTADLTLADLDLPVPPGAKAVGRITRQESVAGSSTQALLEAALSPARVIDFYTAAWPGTRQDRGGPAGPAVFARRAMGHHDTVRVDGQGGRSRIFVVCSRTVPRS